MVSQKKKFIIALSGFILSYIFILMVLFLLVKNGKIGLPFHGIKTSGDVWFSFLKLLPLLGISVSMMIWLVYAKLPVLEPFFWRRFSGVFLVGLAVSLYYAINILFFKKNSLEGLPFWFPLIALCLLNAFSEEIIFRHVMLSLLENVFKIKLIPNLLQSLFYALPHLMYGSYLFALYAFGYGFLLGIIKNKNMNSIAPCIICHFIIDFGAIGAPVL